MQKHIITKTTEYTLSEDQNSVNVTKTTTITAGVILTDYTNFWNSLKVKILESDGGLYTKRMSELTSNPKIANIALNKISADPYATILQFFTTKETANFIKTELGQYDLKLLDQIRDVILHKKGNEKLILYGESLNTNNGGSTELQAMFGDLVNSQANKLGGMLLKTYDSDIFNNWIQTDWIDGDRKSTRLNSSHITRSRMPSSA